MLGTGTLLWRWRRCGRNAVRQAWREQRVRSLVGLLVLMVVWLLVFGLTWALIDFLDREQPHFKAALLDNLLIILCMILAVLVVLSATIITWSALFRTPGSKFLAQLPVSNRALYWHAAIEGGTYASWALLVLGLPILLALTREAANGPLFVLAAVVSLLLFQWFCIGFGALGAVVLARLIPLLRRGLKGILVLVIGGVAVGGLLLAGEFSRQPSSAGFVRQVVADIGFVDNPLLPPRWIGMSLQAALRGEWLTWLHLSVLVISAGATAAILGEALAARRLRRDLDILTGRPERNRGRSEGWRLMRLLPTDIALMVAKDWRLFRRDPAQVLQMGLFVAMLTIYIFMLPRIGQAFQSIPWWTRAVSVLNICAISMALATFTGRFVFPMLSLEGRRMWVLALAPWPSDRLIHAKFAFAMVVGTPVTVLLVVLSGFFLNLTVPVLVYQGFVTVAIAAGLSAAAIGLGARFADYREDNPTKLVSSFGGTLNLLVSLVIVAGCLIGAGIPLVSQGSGDGWIIGIAWTLLWSGGWTVGMLRYAHTSYRASLRGG